MLEDLDETGKSHGKRGPREGGRDSRDGRDGGSASGRDSRGGRRGTGTTSPAATE